MTSCAGWVKALRYFNVVCWAQDLDRTLFIGAPNLEMIMNSRVEKVELPKLLSLFQIVMIKEKTFII